MDIVALTFSILALASLLTASLASVAGFLASTDRLASHSRALDAAHDRSLASLAAPVLPRALSLPAEALGRLMLSASALAMASERKAGPRARRLGYRARSLHSLAQGWLYDGPDLESAEVGDRDVRIGGKQVLLMPAFRNRATLGRRGESVRLAA